METAGSVFAHFSHMIPLCPKRFPGRRIYHMNWKRTMTWKKIKHTGIEKFT